MPIDPLDATVTEALRAWSVQHGAGISVTETLGNCASVCGRSEAAQCFAQAGQLAAQNQGIEHILRALGPVVAPAERALIDAGWQSGRVTNALDSVIQWRELWYNARRKVRSKMVLPAAVLLAAAFVAPLPELVAGGDVLQYIVSVAVPLAVALFLWHVGNAMFQNRLRTPVGSLESSAIAPPDSIDRLLMQLPVVSNVERQRNVGEACLLLGNLVGAGVPITRALDIGAHVLRNGLYRQELQRIAGRVRAGESLGTTFTEGPLWPFEIAAGIRVGEQSGALDDVLLRMGRIALERYEQAVEVFAEWLPRALYALIALFVIYNIFMLVSNIFGIYSGAGL